MLTPIVTEIRRTLEPVVADTFIAQREPSNVVRLVPRDERSAAVPARAA